MECSKNIGDPSGNVRIKFSQASRKIHIELVTCNLHCYYIPNMHGLSSLRVFAKLISAVLHGTVFPSNFILVPGNCERSSKKKGREIIKYKKESFSGFTSTWIGYLQGFREQKGRFGPGLGPNETEWFWCSDSCLPTLRTGKPVVHMAKLPSYCRKDVTVWINPKILFLFHVPQFESRRKEGLLKPLTYFFPEANSPLRFRPN